VYLLSTEVENCLVQAPKKVGCFVRWHWSGVAGATPKWSHRSGKFSDNALEEVLVGGQVNQVCVDRNFGL